MQRRLSEETAELENIRTKSKVDDRRIIELTAEKSGLFTKLRDRDEELRAKAKLLEVCFGI